MESMWVMISAIATAVMAIATFITIRQSRKQWAQSNRASLIFSVEIHDYIYALKIHNVGNKHAYNIRFAVNEEFYDILPYEMLRDTYDYFENSDLHLAPNQIRYLPLYPTNDVALSRHKGFFSGREFFKPKETLDDKIAEALNMRIMIKGKYNRKQNINETFTINEWINYSMGVIDPIVFQIAHFDNRLTSEIKKINTLLSKRLDEQINTK